MEEYDNDLVGIEDVAQKSNISKKRRADGMDQVMWSTVCKDGIPQQNCHLDPRSRSRHALVEAIRYIGQSTRASGMWTSTNPNLSYDRRLDVEPYDDEDSMHSDDGGRGQQEFHRNGSRKMSGMHKCMPVQIHMEERHKVVVGLPHLRTLRQS
jgi:hypothetical protein